MPKQSGAEAPRMPSGDGTTGRGGWSISGFHYLVCAASLLSGPSGGLVVDAKWLVRDKNHRDIGLRAGPVFHDLALGKPHEAAGTERSLVGDQSSFQHVHAVAARVRVPRVNHPRRI